ncbi:MAG: alpha/beta hydrolase [Chlamydiae bacterium]|nr:alpha/beta hydrolase [Chlamydiota bacterium]
MVSAVNPQTISFAAHWDASNSSLQDTLANKVSKFFLYHLHRLAIKLTLPATGISKERVQASKTDFVQSVLANQFERKPIEITTPDGVKLRGTFLQTPGCDTNASVTIFANSNAMLHTEGGFDDVINYAMEKGEKCNFILFDYRECGESEGTAIMAKDLVVDGESIYQFARDQLKIEPKNIHMMGWSFGGGVTARVKALHPECTGNYVNDRSFTSIIDATYELFDKGFFAKIACVLLRFLGWEALNAGNALPNIQGRTLISYHPRDRVIRGTAQLANSPNARPNARRNNIQILELQGQDISVNLWSGTGDRIQNFHCHPLSRITQANGHKAIEEVAEVLFSTVPTAAQVLDRVDARAPSPMDVDEVERQEARSPMLVDE